MLASDYLCQLVPAKPSVAFEVQGKAFAAFIRGDLSFVDYCSVYYRCEQIMNKSVRGVT